jgi:hypothetical protein
MDSNAVDYTRSLYDRHANKAETKDEVRRHTGQAR